MLHCVWAFSYADMSEIVRIRTRLEMVYEI